MDTTTRTTGEITDDMIPKDGIVVFDWDNTLKLYDKSARKISARITSEQLCRWKQEKSCDMYIISAIRPSKINLDTLLFEVEKLGMLDIFTRGDDVTECVPDRYARRGNIVICGYDKAETFLMLQKMHEKQQQQRAEDAEVMASDVVDSRVTDVNERRVVFFDDEEPNIVNFSSLVKDSVCYLVQ